MCLFILQTNLSSSGVIFKSKGNRPVHSVIRNRGGEEDPDKSAERWPVGPASGCPRKLKAHGLTEHAAPGLLPRPDSGRSNPSRPRCQPHPRRPRTRLDTRRHPATSAG
jgi:hypothetical protein